MVGRKPKIVGAYKMREDRVAQQSCITANNTDACRKDKSTMFAC